MCIKQAIPGKLTTFNHFVFSRECLIQGLADSFFSPFGLKVSVATTLLQIIGQAKKHPILGQKE